MGNLQEAIVNGKKAYELDPLNENVGLALAFFLNYSGRGAEALPVLEWMNTLNPRNARIHNRFAECHMMRGDFDKAQEWITRGLELNPREPLLRLNQGLLYALTGRTKEAEASREEIQADKLESVRLYGQLFISAALGNLDEAFKALDRTAETHSWPSLIKTLPVFAELRRTQGTRTLPRGGISVIIALGLQSASKRFQYQEMQGLRIQFGMLKDSVRATLERRQFFRLAWSVCECAARQG